MFGEIIAINKEWRHNETILHCDCLNIKAMEYKLPSRIVSHGFSCHSPSKILLHAKMKSSVGQGKLKRAAKT